MQTQSSEMSILFSHSNVLGATNDEPSPSSIKDMVRNMFDYSQTSKFDVSRLKAIIDEYCIPKVDIDVESESSEEEPEPIVPAKVETKDKAINTATSPISGLSLVAGNEISSQKGPMTTSTDSTLDVLDIPVPAQNSLPQHVLDILGSISNVLKSGEEVGLLKEAITKYFPELAEAPKVQGSAYDVSSPLVKSGPLGVSTAVTPAPIPSGFDQLQTAHQPSTSAMQGREEIAMTYVHRRLVDRLYAFYKEVDPSKADIDFLEPLVLKYGVGIWCSLAAKYDFATVQKYQTMDAETEQFPIVQDISPQLLPKVISFYRDVHPQKADLFTCKQLLLKYGHGIVVLLTQKYGLEKVRQHFFHSRSFDSATTKGLLVPKFNFPRRRSSLVAGEEPHPLYLMPPTGPSEVSALQHPCSGVSSSVHAFASSELAHLGASIQAASVPDLHSIEGAFTASDRDGPVSLFPSFLSAAVPGAFALQFHKKELGLVFRFNSLMTSDEPEFGAGVYLSIEEVLEDHGNKELLRPGDILLGFRTQSAVSFTAFQTCIGLPSKIQVTALLKEAAKNAGTSSTTLWMYFVRPSRCSSLSTSDSKAIFRIEPSGGFRFASAPSVVTAEATSISSSTHPLHYSSVFTFRPSLSLNLQSAVVPDAVKSAAMSELKQMVIPGEKERRILIPGTNVPQSILFPELTQQCPGAFGLKFFHLPLGLTFAPSPTEPASALAIQTVSDKCVYSHLLAPGDLLLGFKQSGSSKANVLEVLLGQNVDVQLQKLKNASDCILKTYADGPTTRQGNVTVRPLILVFARP